MGSFLIFGICVYALVDLSLSTSGQSKPPTYHAVEGHQFRIACKANGNMSAEVYWVKNENGSHFRQNGTELFYSKIRRESSGGYSCYSYNLTSDITTLVQEINVDVLYPAEITGFEVTPTRVLKNEAFSVRCNTTGNPAPDFSLIHDYQNNTIIPISSHGSGDMEHVSYFAEYRDAGTWTCTGQNYLNFFGNATRSDFLNVVGLPETPKNLTYSDLTHNSVTLHWTAGYDGGLAQHFIIIRELFVNPDLLHILNKTEYEYDTFEFDTQGGCMNYVLTNLKPFTAYCFSVVAENALGMSERPTSRVIFQTKFAPSPDWTGVIVGIALGSLGCIATCAFIIYVCVLRYRRKKTSCSAKNEHKKPGIISSGGMCYSNEELGVQKTFQSEKRFIPGHLNHA